MMYRLDLWQDGSPALAEAFVSILAYHTHEPHLDYTTTGNMFDELRVCVDTN